LLLTVALLWPAAAAAQNMDLTHKGLKRDALVLVQGHSKDGFINVKLGRKVQKALARVRAAVPQVAKIHARGFELKSVLLLLNKKAAARLPKIIKKGKTGIPALDRLNAKYKAARVALLAESLLRVRFRQPMDIPFLLKRYKALPQVTSASPNTFVGDGDDITLEMDARQWRFKLKKGSGDCPSGCIRNEYFYVRYDPRRGSAKLVKKKLK